MRPIDQPVEALTVMTDKDRVRVVAGDAGATSAEVINEKNNGDRKKQK
ncbi:hypothetical protein GCM10010965_02100 [Caldalkalibacillus thermarum]|nr:hypothetical protein [Caldalkalibacillus thermarum]GGK12721.1 hypothetical protein GCM10010965_02100 [Caldalkalibacillus thermarum]